MFGWRARIGLMVPARNQVLEPDFNRLTPWGVSIHSTRMRRDVDQSTIETNAKMLNYSQEAAELLSQAGVDIMVLGCTSASFVGGPGQDREISAELTRKTGIPSVTASTAVVEALKTLGLTKITVLTPYITELNDRERIFLNGNGFEVILIKGMGIEKNSHLPKVTPPEIYHFCKENFNQDSDGLFVSCTNFRAVETLAILEQDLGKPVVTSNQACLWKALRSLKLMDRIDGAGTLLSNH